ncbi:hypothetical protein BJV82DRAFT_166861 [Fennellomyces sp. T-0311]|nr:hypothetical protein BJV82DRAFT_166861 [Fennellomyces sp. T-0311]
MIPGNARQTPPRNYQGKQKRNPVPYPRGGRHIGDGISSHQQSPNASSTTVVYHHERSGSTEYNDHEFLSQQPHQPVQQQTSDPALLSVHSTPKDKKKPLFGRFGKKKTGRSDLSSVSAALSSSVGVAAGGPAPLAASAAASGIHSNASMTSLHPRKRSNEYEFRQQHPLDASSMDDSSISGSINQRSPYNSYYNVQLAYGDRKKSAGSYGSRKGKDREKSEGSFSSTGRMMDSGFRSKDNMELFVDQNFTSMEGIVNPDFYSGHHQNNGYSHPVINPIQVSRCKIV